MFLFIPHFFLSQLHYLFPQFHYGAIQKFRNVQKGEGVDDFVTYRYNNFKGREHFMIQFYNGGYVIWELIEHYLAFLMCFTGKSIDEIYFIMLKIS